MTAAVSSSFKVSATHAGRRRETSTRPFSIRLTDAERRHLESEAGSQALGTYVRARLLDNAVRRRTSAPVSDRVALGQLLGKLGQLRLASSLSDLTKAAKVGAIVMTPDLERDVLVACRDVRDMRAMLMRTLGIKPEARA